MADAAPGMSYDCDAQARFDVGALRKLAGPAVFARGEACHRDGRVFLRIVDAERVLARVEGTEEYRTELTGRGKAIRGSCSCPAYGDWGFCKHMVATALAANAAPGDVVSDEGRPPRIRDYLATLGVDRLVEMIIEASQRDEALFRRLEMAASCAQADDAALRRQLSGAIGAATYTGHYIGYREVGGWATEVEEVLDAVASLLPAGRVELVLELAEQLIDGVEEASEEIDDSDGHCGGLLERARDLHIAAACEAKPDPVELARNLFDREIADGMGVFHGAAALYAQALGEAGQAEYRRLASEAWEQLPPRLGGRGDRPQPEGDYAALETILAFFAEQDGGVEEGIALRSKDLSSPWRYLRLAEFCLAKDRREDALRWAEQGLWVFEDVKVDQRLVGLAAELLVEAGRMADAEAHIRRAFEAGPNLDLYRHLSQIGSEAARERAVTFLEAWAAKSHGARVSAPADVLIRVHMHEQRFDQAWAAMRRFGASSSVVEALAQASEATHPKEAVEIYSARVARLVESGGNPAYEQAAALVRRIGTLRGADEQGAYVLALKTEFGRRRNFMALLG
jgi:uncharacterized Zn finger protein